METAEFGESMAPQRFSAESVDGGVRVETNEQGLPLRVTIGAGARRAGPAAMAATVLSLCQRSAAHAGVARRTLLREAGVDPEIIGALGLPTAEQVRDWEDSERDDEPVTWMSR